MNFQRNMRNDSAIKFKGTRYSYLLQVQLASAKLAICLKNSVFGFEKLSFFLGLRLSADSTRKCKIGDLFEMFGLWVRKTEFFARSEVQFLCDVLNILVRDVVEV